MFPCQVLSVWVALSPSRPRTARCDSCRFRTDLGQLPVRYELQDGNMLSSGQVADIELSRFEPVTTSLEPGEASIHHAFMCTDRRQQDRGAQAGGDLWSTILRR